MIECNYSKACTETLKIIDLLSVEDFKKIPDNVIKLLEENKDKSYIFEYDYTKNLTNQNIENLTKAINDSKATLDVLESRIAEVKKLATPADEKKDEKK